MHRYIPVKKAVAIVALTVILIATYSATIGAQIIQKHDTLVFITFAINGMIWICLLLREVKSRSFSLIMVFWFFCVFFFFFAGLIQTVNNKFPWIGRYEDHELLKTNVVLLTWTLLFQLGVSLAEKINFTIHKVNKRNQVIPSKERIDTIFITPQSLFIMSFLTILITAYRVHQIGIINLLARGTSSFAASDNGSIAVLVEKVMMAIVYYSFIYAIFYWQENKQQFPMIITGICMLISYFPTSAARNAVAGLYIGVMLAFFPKMRKNNAFVIIYAVIFMFVFPLFNAFRTVAFVHVDLFKELGTIISGFSSGWLAVDYDAYSMVTLTLRYISQHGVSFGHQLLGVILFWIPRAIWRAKPEGSGPVVAKYFGWWFTNVSEPLPAEMIINFGIIGMGITAIICGFIISKLDSRYWKAKRDSELYLTKYDSLYFYMIGYFLFLYRGALLSAVAYLVAFVVVWLLIPCARKERKITRQNLSNN